MRTWLVVVRMRRIIDPRVSCRDLMEWKLRTARQTANRRCRSCRSGRRRPARGRRAPSCVFRFHSGRRALSPRRGHSCRTRPESAPPCALHFPPRCRSNMRNSPVMEFQSGAVATSSWVQSSGTPAARPDCRRARSRRGWREQRKAALNMGNLDAQLCARCPLHFQHRGAASVANARLDVSPRLGVSSR